MAAALIEICKTILLTGVSAAEPSALSAGSPAATQLLLNENEQFGTEKQWRRQRTDGETFPNSIGHGRQSRLSWRRHQQPSGNNSLNPETPPTTLVDVGQSSDQLQTGRSALPATVPMGSSPHSIVNLKYPTRIRNARDHNGVPRQNETSMSPPHGFL